MNLFTGNARFPCQRISTRNDGLYATAWLGNGQPRLSLWKTESDLKTVVLPSSTPPLFCELTERDTVIVASLDATATPITYTEFAVSTSQPVSTFIVGDKTCRYGASCRLNGNPFFVSYRDIKVPWTAPDGTIHQCSDGMLHLDAVIRTPTAWQTAQFSFPLENGLGDLNGKRILSAGGMAMAEGSDGLAYFFFTNDSSGSVTCVRFRVGAVIQLIDHWGVPLIPEQSISGENPGITATVDKANGRIILGYQSVESIYPPKCQNLGPGIVIVDSLATILMAVYTDKRTQQLARLPWENHHDPMPVCVGWQRTDGLYYVTTWYDTDKCANGGLNFGKQGQSFSSKPLSALLAYSDDGWFIHQRPGADAFHSLFDATQIQFAPAVPAPINWHMEDSTAEVYALITWADRKTADCIEVSTDNGATWKPCLYYAPLNFSADEVRMRVKRS